MFAVGSLSALAATYFSSRLTQRFGPGPTTIGAALLLGVGWLVIPLVVGAPWVAFGFIAIGMLLAGAGNLLWNVTTTSITQTVTPDRLLGRVNASGRFLAWGALPIGSLLGGWLGEQWGLRPTLLLSCGGVLLGGLWVWFSPLRTLHSFPNDEAASAAGWVSGEEEAAQGP
jgi:predicted MFS family arabinose efflux permease